MSEQQQLPLEPSVDLSLVGKMARFYREGDERLGPVVAKSMRMLQNGYAGRVELQNKSIDYSDLPRRPRGDERLRSLRKPQRRQWDEMLDKYPFDQYIAREVADHFGVSAKCAGQGLSRLVDQGILVTAGRRGNAYIYERAEK